MIIGITGHQRLADETSWDWVSGVIRQVLASGELPLAGLSSLAIGADQLFAELLLERGGELGVVLPFANYAETFTPGRNRSRYFALLERAFTVETLPELATREQSYLAAGQRVVDAADWMIAVWNGRKAVGLGGTGDVVRYALESGKEVLHLNPDVREIRRLNGDRTA